MPPTPTRPTRLRCLTCMLYEGLVVFSILVIGFLVPATALSAYGIPLGGKLLWIYIFGLLMAYFVWCWTHGGQTLPMKTWKLAMKNADGGPVRPLQAVFRYCLVWPSLGLAGIGLLWALVDRDGRFLHDRLAGTRIDDLRNAPGAVNAAQPTKS